MEPNPATMISSQPEDAPVRTDHGGHGGDLGDASVHRSALLFSVFGNRVLELTLQRGRINSDVKSEGSAFTDGPSCS